jgi:hypothetical protein
MTTYAGGTAVKGGYYLDLSTFTFAQVARDGGKLPGGDEHGFTRVPVVLVLAAAPVLGGAFVVALPFIAFGVTAYAIGKRLTGFGRAGAREVAATLAPPWAPGAAHLTGAPPSEQGTPPADVRVDELAKEIDAKRKE